MRFATDAPDLDAPWSSSVSVQSTEVPDFTPQRRWTPVLFGALGMLLLAALVAAVITVAHRSSEPADKDPVPAPPSPSTTVAATPAPPSPSTMSPPPPVPAPGQPPASWSVTATASTMVVPPPPVMQPTGPGPKPGVRQRLHDLFPRLFPNR